jgi:hypothetical protein
MIVIRIFGWVLLFTGIVLLAHDAFHGMTATTGFEPVKVSDMWDAFAPGASDDLLGLIKMDYGDGVMKFVAFFLNGWGFAETLLPGLILEAICRPKGDTSHRRARKMTKEAAFEARRADSRFRRRSEQR